MKIIKILFIFSGSLFLSIKSSDTFHEQIVGPLRKNLKAIETERINEINVEEIKTALRALAQDTSPQATEIKRALEEIGHEIQEILPDTLATNSNKDWINFEDYRRTFNNALTQVTETNASIKNKLAEKTAQLQAALKEVKRPTKTVLIDTASNIAAIGTGVWLVKKIFLKYATRAIDTNWLTDVVQIAALATVAYIFAMVWIQVKKFFFGSATEEIQKANEHFSKADQELVQAQEKIALLQSSQIELKKKIDMALYLIAEQILPIVTRLDLQSPPKQTKTRSLSIDDQDQPTMMGRLLALQKEKLRRQFLENGSVNSAGATSSGVQLPADNTFEL